MLAGGLRPLPGRLVTDSRSALGARRARPHATPFAQQHLKFHGPLLFVGSERSGVGPSLKKATGASRPSLQQRLPGAEGPPEGRSTAPRHAACGGPIPSSRRQFFFFAEAFVVNRKRREGSHVTVADRQAHSHRTSHPHPAAPPRQERDERMEQPEGGDTNIFFLRKPSLQHVHVHVHVGKGERGPNPGPSKQ